MVRSPLLVLLLVAACGDTEFVQPGADDPTARQWHRAGQWYPDDPGELEDRVDALTGAIEVNNEPRTARAVLTPHAGIDHSGPTAAEVFARIRIPDTVILLVPNHGRVGEPLAVWDDGPWLVPGHALAIHHEAVARMAELVPDLIIDRDAFDHETAHPAEMQLPFLAHANPNTRLLAISYFDHNAVHFPDVDLELVTRHANALVQLVGELEASGEDVLVLATTDLSHYGTLDETLTDDARLLDPIESLDVDALYDIVREDQLTICGEIPTAILMEFLSASGRSRLDMVVHSNSSETSGNVDRVVGYPGAIAW